MDPVVTLIAVFAIFIPALILLGPDFVGVVRSSMTRGTRAGLMTSVGVAIGLGFYATLGLLGLSTLLQEFHWLALGIRIAGGLYLIYLGIKLLRTGPEQIEIGRPESRQPNALLFGLGVALTNPKAIVLFASVFAAAVTAQTPGWLMVTMIALVFSLTLAWYSLVSIFMSSPPAIRMFGRFRHWIERVAGAVFVVLGGRILLDARNPVL